VALGAVAALLIEGLMSLAAFGVHPEAQHLAFIRTLTLCAAALALAFSGARWRRLELTRMGYATLVLVAVKLVFEDLRHGHLAYIAASIFLVALTLIAVPRLTHREQKSN
jgi:predicted tellurium resistance membrane protein TerC